MKGFLQSDDRELLAGALTAERAAAGGYEALAGRCITPEVRQKMLFLLGEEHRVEEELLEELKTVRANGFAVDRGEFHPDVYCIALPVYSSAGDIYASISISSSKLLEENLTYYRDVIADTIRRLSALS